jgi:hypothetical protein
MPQYFTVDQANAALVLIKPLMAQMMEIREGLLAKQPELESVLDKVAGNGGSKLAGQVAMRFNEMETLIHRIQAMGVVIKDINAGLVDFPALREGREVYLCWRYGEEAVLYWHDIDAGFAGRQPV